MSTPKESPDTLALRAAPRPVTRLNRRTVAIVVGAGATLILGGTLWSMRVPQGGIGGTPMELHNTDRIAHADGLAQLPDDYSKVVRSAPFPKLGPPLPGDFGEAMLRAEQSTPALSPTGTPVLRADPAADAARAERMNRAREAEEAAKGGLFFRSSTRRDAALSTNVGEASSSQAASSLVTSASSSDLRSSAKVADVQDSQQQKRAFLDRQAGASTLSKHSLQAPISPYQVMAGTIIPAALITGIDSDLPGPILASVTENVFDTATGRHLLIPQGSRLVGQYDSQIVFGQRRVLLVWTRLILPDASSITLDRLPGADASGYAGLQDDVDWHWQQLLAGAALATLIGVGAELAAPDRSSGQSQVVIATRQSVQDSVNQVGQEVTRRGLNVQPTLTIRPGFPVRAIVTSDLVLRPYQPLFMGRSGP